MNLVERMTYDPCRCIVCGMGNVPDGDTGEIGPFIDLGIEIGWNDHAYLCISCGTKVGALAGMIAEDEKKDLMRELRKQQDVNHDLSANLEQTQRRLKATQKRLLKVA